MAPPPPRLPNWVRSVVRWLQALTAWVLAAIGGAIGPRTALVMRVAIGLIITLVAGPGLVGFLSEYATYRYAIAQGIRVPAEGVEYLRASVFLIALTIGLAVTSVYVIAWFMAVALRRFAKAFLKRNMFRTRGTQSALLYFMAVTCLAFVIVMANDLFGQPITDALGLPRQRLSGWGVTVGVAYILICLAVFFRIAPSGATVAATLVSTASYLAMLIALFHVPLHGQFLRALRYGGGTHVRITLTDHRAAPLEGALLLRTRHAAILRPPAHGVRSQEILIDRIEFIDYLDDREQRDPKP